MDKGPCFFDSQLPNYLQKNNIKKPAEAGFLTNIWYLFYGYT